MLAVSSVGATLTLLPWGMAADRIGERTTGSVGLLGAAVGLAAAGLRARALPSSSSALAVSGAFGASINTASGRAVTSWFRREERGLALGIRQTSVPIGGFAAALAVPPIADHWGARAALIVLAAYSLARCRALRALARRGAGARRAGRRRGRRAPPPDSRPADLAPVVRQRCADLHAGRGHRLRRPLPRVATRLLGHRGRARARGDQRDRRGRPAVVGAALRPAGRRARGDDQGDRGRDDGRPRGGGPARGRIELAPRAGARPRRRPVDVVERSVGGGRPSRQRSRLGAGPPSGSSRPCSGRPSSSRRSSSPRSSRPPRGGSASWPRRRRRSWRFSCCARCASNGGTPGSPLAPSLRATVTAHAVAEPVTVAVMSTLP